ncbi:preprotein translocase subunit SecE [Alloiococcus otitis]|uniref:Protein translocase subunit SecE n=1 Tax=Alloiococcus otitis ATCC 51267 TaxID=883081 RepID=K9ECV6_9LACT|nr:preprotein translocase subunit SecE [Alloiococcus otitis]EKU93691.1 preprotein translocase, SecE subunit [Alloiococcus otitis ATCC 51267]SUU80287.1 preprotein translocase subunit SecE [Alloiococcus otitis]
MKKVTTFFREVKEEMQKTDWPSGKELRKDSATIFGVLIFFSAFFYLSDWILTTLL